MDRRNSYIQKVLFQGAPDLLTAWMCGRKTVSDVVQYVSDATGIPYDELMEELQYSCEHMTFINEEDVNRIQAIRTKGVGVIIATDNVDTFSRWTVPALRLEDYFDGILLSVDRGALKAHLAVDGTSMFFNHFFLSTGIKPEETILIDDGARNRVVKRLGMNFEHVTEDRPLQWHLREIYEALGIR